MISGCPAEFGCNKGTGSERGSLYDAAGFYHDKQGSKSRLKMKIKKRIRIKSKSRTQQEWSYSYSLSCS